MCDYVWMVYKVLWRNQLQIKPGTLGQTPSLFNKYTRFFYVHYTTHGTNRFACTSYPKDVASWLSVLLKDTCVWLGLEYKLCWTETPKFESGALKAMTRLFPRLGKVSILNCSLYLVGIEVADCQLTLVIKHLFKVWHMPEIIRWVAMKTLTRKETISLRFQSEIFKLVLNVLVLIMS